MQEVRAIARMVNTNPVFPIKIQRIGGRYQKLPLTKNGHLDAVRGGVGLDWSKANGAGIVMGDGVYCLDVDTQKGDDVMDNVRKWAADHDLPTRTRSHRTPSGGWHLIYRLPPGYEDLRTRANVIEGLDTRGRGGWIAYGKGYSVVRDMEPAMMSVKACKALDGGGGVSGHLDMEGYTPPEDVKALDQRLRRVLTFGPKALRYRWGGGTVGLTDTSGSSMDHSVAKLLAIAGWDQQEITWALLNRFEHGSARDKGQEAVALRAAQRSAAKGRLTTDEEKDQVMKFEDAEATEEIHQAMLHLIKQGKRK